MDRPSAAHECAACGASIAHRLETWSGKGRRPEFCTKADNPDCHRARAAARKAYSRGHTRGLSAAATATAAADQLSVDEAPERHGGRRRKYSTKARELAKRRMRPVVTRRVPPILLLAATPVGRCSAARQVPLAPAGRPLEVLAWIDDIFAALDDSPEAEAVIDISSYMAAA